MTILYFFLINNGIGMALGHRWFQKKIFPNKYTFSFKIKKLLSFDIKSWIIKFVNRSHFVVFFYSLHLFFVYWNLTINNRAIACAVFGVTLYTRCPQCFESNGIILILSSTQAYCYLRRWSWCEKTKTLYFDPKCCIVIVIFYLWSQWCFKIKRKLLQYYFPRN